MKKVGIIIAIILAIGLVIATFVLLWKKSQPEDIIYDTVVVGRGNIENSTIATGTVSPRDEVLIKPQISGIVSEVLKEAGDTVRIGDIIATIQVVPESSNLSAAESKVSVARISLNQMQAEYNRQRVLFSKGVIAGEEMEKSEADYQKAIEELSNAKDNLDIIKTGVSKTTAKYSNTQIKSTIDGTILDVPVKVGNSVIQANTFNEGTTIASVANMNDMIFIGKVDETDVGKIHAGMSINLSIGAIDSKKFGALLEYVAPKGVEENGAVLFEIKAAANLAGIKDIRAGYSSNAEIVLGRAQDVLTIPESSVLFCNDSAYVYILRGDESKQVFDKIFIQTGLSNGIDIEVKAGLTEGEKIRGSQIK